MNDDLSVTDFLPSREASPMQIQSNEPEAQPQIHGVADDVYLDTETDGPDGMPTDDDGPDGALPLAGLPGPTSGTSATALVARYCDFSTGSGLTQTGTFATG